MKIFLMSSYQLIKNKATRFKSTGYFKIKSIILYCFLITLIIVPGLINLDAFAASQLTKTGNTDISVTFFWDNFSNAAYDELPVVIERLTSTTLNNPEDAEIATVLAMAHMWKVAESSRLNSAPTSVFDNFIIAKIVITLFN